MWARQCLSEELMIVYVSHHWSAYGPFERVFYAMLGSYCNVPIGYNPTFDIVMPPRTEPVPSVTDNVKIYRLFPRFDFKLQYIIEL